LNDPCRLENDDDDDDAQFAIELKSQMLCFNEREFLPHAGFRVSSKFVQDHFPDGRVQSEFTRRNPYSMDSRAPFLNLSQFSGDLAPFYAREGIQFYAVPDLELTPPERNKIHKMKQDKRDAMFKSGTTPYGKVKVMHVFALFPAVKKRKRED